MNRGAVRGTAFPPPYVGKVEGGVDEGAEPCAEQRFPPPTWGGIGWGVDE